MPIFEIEKDNIKLLNDTDLRELVARLCEAELVKAGHPASAVRWSGAQTAADGGLDVEVKIDVPTRGYNGDFVPRRWTGIQVKKPKMSAGKIEPEMHENGSLRPIITDVKNDGGSYIIVSSGDDCAGKPYRDRIAAMKDAFGPNPEVEACERRILRPRTISKLAPTTSSGPTLGKGEAWKSYQRMEALRALEFYA